MHKDRPMDGTAVKSSQYSHIIDNEARITEQPQPQKPSYDLYAGNLCETISKAELAMYLTSTPIPHFLNDTSHPASQIFTTEMSEYDAKSGMI